MAVQSAWLGAVHGDGGPERVELGAVDGFAGRPNLDVPVGNAPFREATFATRNVLISLGTEGRAMSRYPRAARSARIKCIPCNAPVVETVDGRYVCVDCGTRPISPNGVEHEAD